MNNSLGSKYLARMYAAAATRVARAAPTIIRGEAAMLVSLLKVTSRPHADFQGKVHVNVQISTKWLGRQITELSPLFLVS
jgi:hypothetical protein